MEEPTIEKSPIKVDMGCDSKVYVSFLRKDFADPKFYSLLVKCLTSCKFTKEHTTLFTASHHYLPKLIARLRDANLAIELKLSPTVAYELAQMVDRETDLDAESRANTRIANIESVTPYRYREYQKADIRWMESVGNCILGNEMRTGKTPTIIGMIGTQGALVVCPLTVRGVWADHVARWLPWMKVDLSKGALPRPGVVVITNYAAIPAPPPFFDIPAGLVLVADEAAALKNPKTGRTAQFKSWAQGVTLREGKVILATGTPAKNGRPDEIWSLLEILGKSSKLFTNKKRFTADFKSYAEDLTGPLNAVITQRSFASVVGELPPFTREVLPVSLRDLDGTQHIISVLDDLWGRYGGFSDPVAALKRTPKDAGEYSKLRTMLAAAKIPFMEQWVQERMYEHQPVIVASDHRAPVLHMSDWDKWGVIHGDVPEAVRTDVQRRFQHGELQGVAFTIATAGVGLDFSRADQMLCVDESYVPGDNDQATARIMSVVNPRPKTVYVLVFDHPLEMRTAEILATKRQDIKNTIGRVGTNSGSILTQLQAEVNKPKGPEIDISLMTDVLKGIF